MRPQAATARGARGAHTATRHTRTRDGTHGAARSSRGRGRRHTPHGTADVGERGDTAPRPRETSHERHVTRHPSPRRARSQCVRRPAAAQGSMAITNEASFQPHARRSAHDSASDRTRVTTPPRRTAWLALTFLSHLGPSWGRSLLEHTVECDARRRSPARHPW
jgi:hypothetical protein